MNTIDITTLANHFLVAMPAMTDLFFKDSVVYLCEHSEQGAMGLLINKPSPIMLTQLFDQVKTSTPVQFQNDLAYFGGPLHPDRGFLLHTPVGKWQTSLRVSDEIALTTSKDILTRFNEAESGMKMMATLGYSGWQAGQLEQELANNDWLIVPADAHIMFDVPSEERYGAALGLLGLDAAKLMSGVGHA
ncbi:MAG: YqgE/AlgH family protein [Neisseriaceae bacterium]|nr:YqgE/AlgH family protein [Neisseriaceae bacterium]